MVKNIIITSPPLHGGSLCIQQFCDILHKGNHSIVVEYRIVQNIWGPKLSRLGHHVSIHGKLSHLHQNNIHKCQNTLKFMGNIHSSSKNHENRKSFDPQTFCTILYITLCVLMMPKANVVLMDLINIVSLYGADLSTTCRFTLAGCDLGSQSSNVLWVFS